MKSLRLFILGLLILIALTGITLIVVLIDRGGATVESSKLNALAKSTDECVVCHSQKTSGIVEQFSQSSMAVANVSCRNCHEVNADYPGAEAHEGTYILASPTTAKCQTCHQTEVEQYLQSRHGLPAYVAVAGSTELSSEHLALYHAIPEGQYSPDKSRNAIAALEGENMTIFTCESCHDIGAPAEDGSVGQCQKCHIRHEFSLEQARKPETCNACHIGPDHPQWEIYEESYHGISYMTSGDSWNWEADPGTLDVSDFPAPTCAVCHMSGFGTSETTHDVGNRLTWFLFAPISERRPDWETNMAAMQGVCLECHNKNFVTEFYASADTATEQVNTWIVESNEILQPLKDAGLLTAEAFDEPIDYTYFEIWHHWGRTTKFGIWMQGADYAQWHGAYEILHDTAELREMVKEKLDEASQEK